MNKLELKVPPLMVTSFCGLIIWIIQILCKFDGGSKLSLGFSILFLVAGVIISLLGVFQFKKMRTTVNPMTPQDSNNLVISGVYKYTRNPMYVGFLLWLCSFGFFFSNPISLVPIVFFYCYMNRFQIIPEERFLEEKFGEQYIRYKNSVRRWI